MPYILHLSDFHFAGDKDTLTNRFSDLAEYLNERGKDIKYIVCTGDFLEQKLLINTFAKDYCDRNKLTCPKKSKPDDFRKVFLNLVGSLSDTQIQDYNNTLINSMKTEFSVFSLILNKFMRQVNVDSKHLVICCGNHDKTWIFTDKTTQKGNSCVVYNTLTDTIEREKDGEPPADDERCYEAFDYFCELLNLDYNHNTHLHSVDDDFEFLIMNSNYGKENREKLCVNCLSLNDYINNKNHKFHSAVVMHAPFRSLCENFDMTYGSEENVSILSALLNSASLCMCGDKHTNDRRSLNGKPVFMSGKFAYDATLKTSWNCRLIGFDNTKEYIDSTVFFRDGRWQDNLGIKEAIETSLKYGNETSIKKLIGDHKVTNPATVLSSRKEEYYIAMSQIIKSVCNYKSAGTKDYITFDDKTNLFDFLDSRFLTMIDQYAELGPDEQKGFHSLLKLVGNTGVGKSTFVYALWADALYRFTKYQKAFLPLVFDFSKHRGKRLNDIKQLWKEFLTESDNLSKTLNVSIVCIVDGLQSFWLIPDTKTLLEYIMRSFNQYERLFYVISVEKHRGQYPLQNTLLIPSEEVNWFGNDYMCINNVDVYKYEDASPNKEMEASVRYSIELSDRIFNDPGEKGKCAKDAAEFLQKIGYAEVSLSTLKTIINSPYFDSWMSSTEKSDRSKEKARKLFYNMLHDRWASDSVNPKLVSGAYNLSYGNVKKIGSIPDVDRLIMDAEYRNFLCSQHILNNFELDKGDKLSWKTSHAVAILVRSAVNLKEYSQTTLSNKLSSIVDKSKGKASLIVVYLIGTCLNHESRIGLLTKIIEKHPLPSATEMDEFNYEDYKNIITHFFARFLILFGDACQSLFSRAEIKKQFFDALQAMIKSQAYMKYYRIFMLDYYGDLEHNRLTVSSAYKEEAKDIKNFEGYDFKRYFTSLAANIKEKTAEFPDEYVALILCDIVYSRLMKSVENPGGKYFFNSSVTRYNDQSNILKTTLECINTVLKRRSPLDRNLRKLKDNNDVYNLYYRYLTTLFAILKDCQSVYSNNSSVKPDNVFIEISKIIKPAWAFECVSDLKWQPRAGWYYKESPAECSTSNEIRNHTQAIYEKKKNEYFPETIAEHCFECMLIAEMYLPDSIDIIKQFEKNHDTGGYDKTIVIRILLTYETGKAQVGDKPEQHIEAKEKDDYYEELDIKMYRLMLHEVLSGYTSGDNLHFLQSKVKYAGGSHDYDYNEKLAKDIEIIQREYTRIKYASKLQFTEKRNASFEMAQQELNTEYGKELLRILVIDNPFLPNYLTTP